MDTSGHSSQTDGFRVERAGAGAGGDGTLRDWRHVHNLVVPTAPLSPDEVRERAGRNRLDVAYLGDVLVGCMTVRPAAGEDPVVVIARVLPEYRGRGLGVALYEHGLAQAREFGAVTVRTVVLETNPEGLRFALARGFVEVERYVLPGDTVAFIDLDLDLDPGLDLEPAATA
ncbi:GNAT family N-acetyltransferase [Streptomyces sp. NPDC059072]|uniref:GNAT family N-acetyltransferase n=1 Tax=unclassified Streptomyces TaxID=2593676 RepID=UPI0036C9761A